jgi:hypothetical protein
LEKCELHNYAIYTTKALNKIQVTRKEGWKKCVNYAIYTTKHLTKYKLLKKKVGKV